MTRLEQFKHTCKKYLIMENTDIIDIIFGCVFANRLDSKPIWLYIVAPPSSGKTEILQALSGHDEIHSESTLTRHALISGFEQTKKKQDHSLIPKLDGKILIIKDFTTMLKMRKEDLMEILGTLRDAFDGTCTKRFGNQVSRSYVSKFGVIAAVTDIIDHHRGLLSALGERFLTYRPPDPSESEKTARALKAMQSESTTTQESALRSAAYNVLNCDPYVPTIEKYQQRSIATIARFVSSARCEVTRNRFTREPDIPRPEHHTRLSKQLGDLAAGIAMAREKEIITWSEIRLVQKAALHSISLKRWKLIELLVHTYPNWVEICNIAETMHFSGSAVTRWFEDLLLLNLVKKRVVLRDRELTQFQITRGKELRKVLNLD